MSEVSFITTIVVMIGMFRRRFRRTRRKFQGKAIQHIVASIGNAQAANTQLHFVATNAGAFATIGTSATTVATALSNKEQEVVIGSKVNFVTFDVTSTCAAPAVMEYAVVKVERSVNSPPAVATELPTSAIVLAQGLQKSMREWQPGRVLHFSTRAGAEYQPISHQIKVNFKKFRMPTIRQGDWLMLIVNNRSAGVSTTNVQCRYKEIQ